MARGARNRSFDAGRVPAVAALVGSVVGDREEVSIGDVVNARLRELETETEQWAEKVKAAPAPGRVAAPVLIAGRLVCGNAA